MRRTRRWRPRSQMTAARGCSQSDAGSADDIFSRSFHLESQRKVSEGARKSWTDRARTSFPKITGPRGSVRRHVFRQVLEEHPSVALGLLLSASAPVSLSALDSANRSLFSACADRASSELVTNKRGRHKHHGGENLSRYSELDAENARIGGEIRVARQEIASLS